ncbi:MAG: Asp-tRNA(Asn)/Glu-tRNA(Gln) amidotransferase subunit GatC [Patescibacteria group bacterium]|nr:Asp-tRNA(Asn)/Glu-tRNA(Gln) amidotransferase subunit GatC [Patescibacteria group bacterium]
MDSNINKETLKHLMELARLEVGGDKEEKLLKDIKSILSYFEELQSLDTQNIEPMTGGTNLKNVFRGDEERENSFRGSGAELFPESQDGFLKIPAIFKEKNAQ